MNKAFITLIGLLGLSITSIAQATINSSGGDAVNANGSVAYSVGYFSSSIDQVGGSVYTGPQIPLSFLCDDLNNNGICDDAEPYPTPPGSGDALAFDGVDDEVL